MSYETVTVVGTLLAVVLAVVVSNWAMLRNFRTELKADIAAGAKETASLRTELKADIAELRTELKADIAELRSESKGDIAAGAKETASLRAELKADIAAGAKETASLRTELVGLNQRIDATNSRIDRLADSLMLPRRASTGA